MWQLVRREVTLEVGLGFFSFFPKAFSGEWNSRGGEEHVLCKKAD